MALVEAYLRLGCPSPTALWVQHATAYRWLNPDLSDCALHWGLLAPVQCVYLVACFCLASHRTCLGLRPARRQPRWARRQRWLAACLALYGPALVALRAYQSGTTPPVYLFASALALTAACVACALMLPGGGRAPHAVYGGATALVFLALLRSEAATLLSPPRVPRAAAVSCSAAALAAGVAMVLAAHTARGHGAWGAGRAARAQPAGGSPLLSPLAAVPAVPPPEDMGPIGHFLFTFAFPTLYRGWRARALHHADLPPLPRLDTPPYLHAVFTRSWAQSPSVLATLVRGCWRPVAGSVLLLIPTTLVGWSHPVLLHRLLRFAQAPEEAWYGYTLAVGLWAAVLMYWLLIEIWWFEAVCACRADRG